MTVWTTDKIDATSAQIGMMCARTGVRYGKMYETAITPQPAMSGAISGTTNVICAPIIATCATTAVISGTIAATSVTTVKDSFSVPSGEG